MTELRDLKQRLWACAEVLRGSAVDRTDWKAQASPSSRAPPRLGLSRRRLAAGECLLLLPLEAASS